MSTLNRLFKNTTALVVAKGIQPLISLFLIITITKKLDVSGLGAYITILSFVEIFQIIAAFGLRNLLTREVAQNRDRAGSYFAAVPMITIISSGAAMAVMILAVHLLSKEPIVEKGAIIISLSLVAAAMAEAYEGIIGGFEKLSRVGLAWFIENVSRVLISIALLFAGFGLFSLLWVYIAVRYLKAIYYYFYIRRLIGSQPASVSWPFIKELLVQARVFALIMVCVMIYWKADVVMLQSMKTTDDVGYYSAAHRIFMMARILVTGFMTSFFPVIANLYKTSAAQFEKACKQAIRFLVIITVPIAIAVSLLARPILMFVFGEDLLPSVLVLQILIWVVVPYGISQVFAYALVSSNRQRFDLYVNILSMFANLLLNYLLIPKYNYYGAAAATLISIHIYVLFQLPFIFPRIFSLQPGSILRTGLKILAASAVMVAFILLARHASFMITGPLSVLVYFAAIYFVRVVPGEDLQVFARMLRRPA
ncbi:MAG: oligosaccharide flippase family protein [candidate division KSB1 bacterium]|nr:oligosaccharide flippase family protein [candidate division KSB1 bacterium]MDQ7063614.1 oligosaccharide flippase family protein [candidate division KSB1 bacterium]